MNISERLKFFLEEKKLDKITASSVADYLGISKKTLSNYVNGDAYIPLNHLNRMCNFFHVSMDYLLGLSDIEVYFDNIELENLDAKEIGNRLKNIRRSKKVTQEQVSKTIGVNKSSISRYENGESLILTICLYTFCKKYSVSSDYIVGKTSHI